MKKNITWLVMAIVAITTNTYAQYASDALRFSQADYGSSARFKAMGNAQIGTGGDISSLGGNPAGLGLFTKSEFSLTPNFSQANANATYLGQNNRTPKNQLNIDQIGAVFQFPTYKYKGQDTKKGVLSLVLGIGYNRTNNFSLENNYGGANKATSIADFFAESAGNRTPNNLGNGTLEKMAYDNYLISFDNVANNYFPETFADNAQSNLQQKNEIRIGSNSEFNFAGALNISNQIYIGASVGLININYISDGIYTETGRAREYNGAGNLTGSNINYKLLFNQNQTTKGSGVNGRLGIIFRGTEGLRLGFTVQTPTWLTVNDSYTEGLDNRGTIRGTNNNITYDFTYNLRTPVKGSLGASYVVGGKGIITADVDFIDFASARFSTLNSADFDVVNNTNTAIRKNYKGAVNYRVGGEYKINNVSLRAGYGLNGSPFKTDDTGLFDTKIYSAGLGYRVNNYYIDLAYQNAENTNTFSPYTLNNGTEPVANVVNTRTNVFLTFGLRF